jgi:small-conductance mechanosensitive channel
MTRFTPAFFSTVLFGLFALVAFAAGQADRPHEVLAHVNDVAAWYERAVSAEQGPAVPGEALYRDATRRASRQVLDLTFEYARAEAARAASAGSSPSSQPGRGRRLEQASASAAERVAQLRADLDAAGRQAATRPADPDVVARRDRTAAELNLATVRRDALQRIAQFRDAPDEASDGTLSDKLDAILRSVPAAGVDDAASAGAVAGAAAGAAAAASTPAASPAEQAGLFGVVGQMFQLSRRMRELKDLADDAEALRQASEKLRAPLRDELMAAVRRADAISAGPATQDDRSATQPARGAAESDAERRELDTLAARVKQLSDAAAPLARQRILLGQARTSLLDWRAVLGRHYLALIRTLLVRLGVTGAVIAALFVVSVLWRRATFRYIHDPRRRRQFMLLRRAFIGCALVVVGVFSFVSEFGSLATFAGILTAGIAVSLQTLILSGVAYFFFVGRYGVRVGDRVTVAGVTGEVLETGLLRLYLMELGGSRRVDPTGRVVVFSNSVLFQPTGFFKQVPGADYVWHEVSMTLAPDSDHRLAEARLLGAAESVFSTYRESIDRQHATARRSGAVPAESPRPNGRLRFVDAGLEFTLRYPVEASRASEVEDRLTRALLAAIEQEPRLRVVPSETPVIQAVPQGA